MTAKRIPLGEAEQVEFFEHLSFSALATSQTECPENYTL
jgi:hypothetical protein